MPSKPASRASSNFCRTLILSAVAPRNELYIRPFFRCGRFRAVDVAEILAELSAASVTYGAATAVIVAWRRNVRRFMVVLTSLEVRSAWFGGRCSSAARDIRGSGQRPLGHCSSTGFLKPVRVLLWSPQMLELGDGRARRALEVYEAFGGPSGPALPTNCSIKRFTVSGDLH